MKTALRIKKKKFLDLISSSKNTRYTSFIILCGPRSGSTLLHTYLNSHPGIVSYGEVLRENLERAKPVNNVITSVVFAAHTDALKAIGLKIFYEYFDDIRYAKDFEYILTQKHIKVIHLTRKNSLKQYASLKIAQATNVWSADLLKKISSNKIAIDPNDYAQYLQQGEEHRVLFSARFKEHEILEVSYEELVSESHQTLLKIQRFLAVKPRKLFSLLTKQNVDSLEDLIENYSELKNIV